jgi:hypothetical protein
MTITFDDNSLNGAVTDGALIPSGYKGFNWNYWFFVHRLAFVGSGYQSGTVSGDYASFNGGGSPAFMSRGTAFSVLRLYAQSAWHDSGNVITFQGFDALDNVVATHVHKMGTRAGGPYLIVLPSSFGGIYKFKFASSNMQLAIDDLVVVV